MHDSQVGVVIGGTVLPAAFEQEELLEAARNMMNSAAFQDSAPFEFQGRPLTNLEMAALRRAKMLSFESVLERWSSMLDDWLPSRKSEG